MTTYYYLDQLNKVLNDSKDNLNLINFKFSSGQVSTKVLNLNKDSIEALKSFIYKASRTDLETPYRLYSMRITGENKNYYLNQLQEFSNNMSTKFHNVASVEFGKQDTRGTFSICVLNISGCVAHQKFFDSKAALLSFVSGYNSANSNQAYL